MNAIVAPSRSTFVTVLGWILIALSALALLTSVGRGVWLEVATQEVLAAQPRDMQVPGQLISGLFRGVSLLNVVLTASLTYAAYAFLARRNWARRTFVVLFAIGLAGNVLTVLLFGTMFGFAGAAVSQVESPLGQIGSLFAAMFVFWAVFAIGFAVLFGWLIKRLRSPAVKAEFGSARAGA